jgi:hypothetical protein
MRDKSVIFISSSPRAIMMSSKSLLMKGNEYHVTINIKTSNIVVLGILVACVRPARRLLDNMVGFYVALVGVSTV